MDQNAAAVESLLAFWADAGVDTLYDSASVNRTRPTLESLSVAQVRARENAPPAMPTTARPPVLTVDMDQARALAAAAKDLIELGDAIKTFEGCGLKHAGAKQSVFFRAKPDASVMVIGEAPGAEEDLQGLPFVGRAGQLLDRMLAAAGLADEVLITNTVFWRPPGNRTPTADEQLACRPFLERAIALSRPQYLLLLGGAATKAMLGQTEGILSLRGRWFEWRSEQGELEVPAIPTLHPAFLLRQPAAKKMAWRDLLTLAERLTRPARPT